MENNITKDKLEKKIGFTDEELNVARALETATALNLSSSLPLLCVYSRILQGVEQSLGLSYNGAREFVKGMVEKNYASFLQKGYEQDDWHGPLALAFTLKAFDLMDKYYAKKEARKCASDIIS